MNVRRLLFLLPILPMLAGLLLLVPGQAQTETGCNLQDCAILVTQSGSHTISVELAVSTKERASGLMHRKSMPENSGMLFDFGSTRPIFMWMKNTFLSLDMVFVNKAGRVVSIIRDTKPLSETILTSKTPVRYVLEVPAGTANKLKLHVDDQIRHSFFLP